MSRRVAASVLVLCLILCAAADKPAKLKFLTEKSLDVFALIPPPPSETSDEQKRELALVLAAQQTRTDADVERAKSEDKLSVFAFTDVLGAGFSAERCPKTAALFEQIDRDSKFFSALAKARWNRPRPPFVDKEIKPVTKLENEGSYPSGHATRGMLFAEVLAEAVPARKEALLERGRQIGWDRVLAGVHYPSDVIAGRVLGHSLMGVMLANPEFQAELQQVKEELAGLGSTAN